MEVFQKVISKKPLNERIMIVKLLIEATNPAAEREQQKHDGANLEQIGNFVYVSWVEGNKGFIKLFGPKASFPKKFYGYPNEDQMNKALDRFRKAAGESAEYKTKRKDDTNQKKTMMGQLVYEGDIFYSSWGYDQTNVEFYEVTKKISNDTLEVRELKQKTVESGNGGYQMVTAIPGQYVSPPTKVRITQNGISLKAFGISSANGRPWDGKPTYSTAAGYGH